MGKFKEKIYRFMYGRYGVDELYKFSMVVFFILWLVFSALNFKAIKNIENPRKCALDKAI